MYAPRCAQGGKHTVARNTCLLQVHMHLHNSCVCVLVGSFHFSPTKKKDRGCGKEGSTVAEGGSGGGGRVVGVVAPPPSGRPGAQGAAGAAAGAAAHRGQVAVAQGAGGSAAERAAQDKAVGATEANRRAALPTATGALHLFRGMPNASSIVSTAP